MKTFLPARHALAFVVLTLACSVPAIALEANPISQSCRADYGKFCTSVKPGGGRIAECLKQHEAELAPACQSALAKITDCGQQVRQICGTAAPGRDGLRECLNTHAQQLGADCRTALPGQ